MKKQLLLFVMMLLPLMAMADAVEIDGIYYNLNANGKVAEVTSNPNKYTGSIVIPETVNYDNITYGVTSIGNYTFNGCSDLISVTIPNSVTSIGEAAFEGCSSLVSITIPNSVTRIGDDAFSGCSGLKKVIVSDIAAWCGIKFGTSVLGSFYANPLYSAKHLYSDENTEIKDLVIPNSVTSIGGGAFSSCSGLTSVTIPNSVTSIGDYAFYACSGLTSITIPNNVTSIGDNAFFGCI